MKTSSAWVRRGCGVVLISMIAAAHGEPPAIQYNSRAKATYGPIFTQVLKKFINGRPGPNICLPPLFGFGEIVNEPVTVPVEADANPFPAGGPRFVSQSAQMKALESAGLVTGVKSTRTINGKEVSQIEYRRTPKGLAASQGPSICYASAELDHVVRWKGPVVFGEYQAAFVYYTVKTTHIEPWAKAADVQAAFPTMEAILKGDDAKVRQVVIDLSSDGWDVAEFSKYLQMQ